MNIRQIISGVTAVTLALAGVLVGSGMASAEDLAPPPTDPIVEVVEETSPPAPEPPAQPVEPAPAPEEAPPPSEPVSAPQVAPQTAPEVTPQTQTPNEGVCQPQDAHQFDASGPSHTIYAPEGKVIIAVCVKAGSIQQGNGPENVPGIPAEGVESLTFSHSSGKNISHYVVTYADKEPEIPAPLACVPTSANWYTEVDDITPTATPQGLRFQDADPTKAVGIRVPVTGNLQGWESLTFSNTGGTEQFFFRIVISSPGDGFTYKSLSFPGYTTIDQNSVAYQTGKSIAQMVEVWPNAVITSVGFQTNSAAPADYVAVLQSVSGPCAVRDFVPEPPVNECVPTTGTHSTNLADLWANVDTRSKGHVEYVEGGLHVWTDDNSSQAKVSEGMAVNFPLHDVGILDIEWDGTTPPPGINLFVDFGDKNGTLVYEEVYGQDLWLTQGGIAAGIEAPVVGGGNGSTHHGTINQWLELYPDAVVTGIAYSLGSGVHGDGVIKSITVGCATHTFDFEREVPVQPEPKVEVGEWSEPVVDCDTEVGDELVITREVTTTPYVFDEEAWEWVLDTENAETVTEEDVIVVEDGMLEDLECPVPTPEPTPTPTTTPAPASNNTPSGGLAVTGGEMNPIVPLGAGIAVFLGGLALMLVKMARARRNH